MWFCSVFQAISRTGGALPRFPSLVLSGMAHKPGSRPGTWLRQSSSPNRVTPHLWARRAAQPQSHPEAPEEVPNHPLTGIQGISSHSCKKNHPQT